MEKVHYITAPGKRVKTVVSHLGVYEKQQDDGELVLTAVLPNPNKPSLEDRIKDAKENCGWELKVAPNVKDIAPPTLDELIITRLFDPRGVVLSDYRPYSAYKGPDQEMCSWGSANRKDIER